MERLASKCYLVDIYATSLCAYLYRLVVSGFQLFRYTNVHMYWCMKSDQRIPAASCDASYVRVFLCFVLVFDWLSFYCKFQSSISCGRHLCMYVHIYFEEIFSCAPVCWRNKATIIKKEYYKMVVFDWIYKLLIFHKLKRCLSVSIYIPYILDFIHTILV